MLSRYPAISDDCRLVVFASAGTDLVSGRDENGSREDVYAFEVSTRALRRLSVNSSGIQSSRGASFAPSASGNGRYVTFTSTADLDARFVRESSSSPSLQAQIYVRDTELGTTTRVSAGPGLTPLDGASYDSAHQPRWTLCRLRLPGHESCARRSESVRRRFPARPADRDNDTREPTDGWWDGKRPSGSPAISADGRFIAFQSEASDLVCIRRCPAALDDVNLLSDVFLLDRVADRMTWISALPSGDGPRRAAAPTGRHRRDRDVRVAPSYRRTGRAQ